MPTVLRALNPIGVPIAIGDVAGYLAGKVSIENPVPTRASQVSAPTFNASATRACVTSLATLKSDWWPSTLDSKTLKYRITRFRG